MDWCGGVERVRRQREGWIVLTSFFSASHTRDGFFSTGRQRWCSVCFTGRRRSRNERRSIRRRFRFRSFCSSVSHGKVGWTLDIDKGGERDGDEALVSDVINFHWCESLSSSCVLT